MGTKEKPGSYDCLAQALPDEPFFTLLGRDRHAAELIEIWAQKRRFDIAIGRAPKSDEAKVAEAVTLAAQMRAWRRDNDGAWRDVDPAAEPIPAAGASDGA